jgi:perosamine synthetase
MQKINQFTIPDSDSLESAMKLIDENGRGVCFAIRDKKLVGILTDGDLRRALIRGISITQPIFEAMNKNFTSLPINSDEILIRRTFSSKVKIIPLCNEAGEVVDFADVQKSHRIPVLEPDLSGRELEYVEDCIRSNWISSQGAYVIRFEKLFEKMHPGMHGVAVANGTVALHLALLTLGIGVGDEVIVPDLTFAATINAVIYCQATPVLCEVDSETWCMNLEELEKLVTPKTKAILPVHLYGQPCNMDEIVGFAKINNLMIVEDCAESLGSAVNNKIVGVFGNASTFSFFGNKTITTGEGGMCLFSDEAMAQKARILRDHGMSPGKRYWHDTVGFNYRLTNLQAAIGVAQMERFDEILKKKLRIANLYFEYLHGIPGIARLPCVKTGVTHSNWLFTIILQDEIDRDCVMHELLLRGIDTRPVFYPLHTMPPYQSYRTSNSLAHSNRISNRGISLPTSTTIQLTEIKFISSALKEILYAIYKLNN